MMAIFVIKEDGGAIDVTLDDAEGNVGEYESGATWHPKSELSTGSNAVMFSASRAGRRIGCTPKLPAPLLDYPRSAPFLQEGYIQGEGSWWQCSRAMVWGFSTHR